MKYRLMLMAVAVATAFLALPIMAATTWYVNGTTGSDSYIGTSESSAKATIQAAIDEAIDGDTILVAPGTYAPITTENKMITICGTAGAANTYIDGMGISRCVTVLPEAHVYGNVIAYTNTCLYGFTLQNGVANEPNAFGGGAYCGTYHYCVFNSNRGGGGGGCYGAVLHSCLLIGNYAKNGGATESCACYNCTITGNSVRDSGVAGWDSAFVNCIIYENDGWSTFYYARDDGIGAPAQDLNYCKINCYEDDPSFVDAANGDYRLAAGSPCIDAGDNSYVTSDKDLAGNARIVNGTVDIGCYEYRPTVSNLYMVIDLSGGPTAASYPVSYLDAVPDGGWTDEYKTTKLVMRRISAGSFMMGDGKNSSLQENGDYVEPVHLVTLTRDFYIGVFQVTQRQWELVMGSNPSYFSGYSDSSRRPVETVSYNMIRGATVGAGWPQNSNVDDGSFLSVIRAKTRLDDLDLPTSAQWEYACRAGTSTDLNTGVNLTDAETDSILNGVGWYKGNSSGSTHEVGACSANNWGLYDMHGNVWEWCLDWYDYPTGETATDPSGPSTKRNWGDAARVFRGGSHNNRAGECRSACVGNYGCYRVDHLWGDFGFRLAMTVTEIVPPPTKTYTVTFDPNGGSLGAASPTREVEDGNAVGTLPDATREGYALAGWFTDANGGTEISENTIVTNDVTYYAQWEPISYTVAFNANGGLGAMDAMPCVYGEGAITPDCIFRRVGYAFDGWSLDSDGDAAVAYLPGQDASRLTTQAGVVVTLYAVWRHGCDGIWSIGGDADWFAESVDEPHEGGYLLRSGAIGDGQEAWIETVVTSDCRVSFDWKSSCEPLLKGRPYDYLAFAVDGNQVGFICGETGWTNETFCVTGEGEHSLRWTFQKDDQDSAGEDCAWIANVKVVPSVTLTFADGGATAGTAPEPMAFYADDGSATLPGCGTLVKAKHTFAGWNYGENMYAAGTAATNVIFADGATVAQGVPPYQLTAMWSANTLSAPVIVAPETYEADSATVTITADDGATIYYTLDGSVPNPARPEAAPYQGPFEIEGSAVIRAIAVKDNYYDSEVASFTVTRPTWTFGEYLNCPERTFATGGDAEWLRAKGVSDDGYALRSGAVGDSQTSRLETVVYGAGTVTFAYRVEGEIVKKVAWDGLAFCIDGVQQGDLMGENTWTNKSFTVTGNGRHTLSWLYVKDEEGNGDGEDCAWLDNVVWTAGDPLPPLDVTAADNDAKAILGVLSDVWLSEKIVCTSGYTAFRSWVDGKGLSHVLVSDAPNAWLSYALDAPGLMAKDAPLANEDVVIESIVPSAVAGAFDLVVNIADSEIGEGARLAEVFGVEGATELNESMFSSDNVSVTLERTADGKARFTVTRRLAGDGSPHQTGNSFFMRVKVK